VDPGHHTEVLRHFVVLDGRCVHYRRGGSGPAIVLLHSTPRSSAELADLISELAVHRTVLAPDLPGHGLSEPLPVEEPTIGDYADSIRSLLAALGVARAPIYGRQLGALVARELARTDPSLVSQAFLDELPALGPGEGEAFLNRWAPPLEPRIDGTHIVAQWTLERDGHIIDPLSAVPRRALGELPSAEQLNEGLLDRLRAGAGYARGYRAIAATAGRRPEPGALESPVTERALRELVAQLLAAEVSEGAVPQPPPVAARAGRRTPNYANTPFGQIHLRFRRDVDGVPLVLLHGSPSSGGSMEELLDAIAPSRPVYAFDMLGGGESDKPSLERHPQFADATVADFAAVALSALDALGLERVDLYGNHTGSMVALEMALAAPERIRRVVLDGVTTWDDEAAADLIANYFVDFSPTDDGSHLMVAWNALRNATLWFPWYRTVAANALAAPLATPLQVHNLAMDALRRGAWHRRLHMPIFNYRAAERLPRLRHTAMICAAAGDVLGGYAAAGASLLPSASFAELPINARVGGPQFPPFSPGAEAAQFIARFLDEG
jgi:pimeloyl-ACP methyl ester carboxylesterase